MTSTRTDRRERARSLRLRRAVALVGAIGVLALVAGAWFAMGSGAERPAADDVSSVEPTQVVSLLSTPGATSESTAEALPAIEVPKVAGMTIAEARVLLQAAGLTVEISVDSSLNPKGTGDQRKVAQQEPPAGEIASAGDLVSLSVPSESVAQKDDAEKFVVCIDPGHQERSDSGQEPIGPGATETKERVSAGTTGVETGLPEYEINLQISMNLKERLEEAGVKVVMTRTVNDVNVANSARAEVANNAHADLFVRVHGDGSPDPETAGVTTLYPGVNEWTEPFSASSKRAADAVHQAVIAATGATSCGLKARNDMSGFNWSKVPVVLVECGFMTNPIEDKLLASPHYQDKLAQGMADGILEYLKE